MHPAVEEFVAAHWVDAGTVLDLGGRDVNGTLRHLWPAAMWTVLDAEKAPDVDIVADAADWNPHGRRWDLVLCTEVLEHAERWPRILLAAYRALRSGGTLIVTCAGPGREPHGSTATGVMDPDEWYGNIGDRTVRGMLTAVGFQVTVCAQVDEDVQAVAVKP